MRNTKKPVRLNPIDIYEGEDWNRGYQSKMIWWNNPERLRRRKAAKIAKKSRVRNRNR